MKLDVCGYPVVFSIDGPIKVLKRTIGISKFWNGYIFCLSGTYILQEWKPTRVQQKGEHNSAKWITQTRVTTAADCISQNIHGDAAGRY